MKIAIPTRDGRRISSNINSIGGFNVYEITNGEISSETFISRKHAEKKLEELQTDNDGSNEKEISFISVIWDCQIVISNGFGREMFEEFTAHNHYDFEMELAIQGKEIIL